MKYINVIDEDHVKVNQKTGEIEELKKHIKIDQEKFIMVFLNAIPEIANNLERNEMRLLMYIWRVSHCDIDSNDEGNIIENNARTKNRIRECGCDMKDNAINVYFTRLAKKDFLLKRGKGTYMLNPKYFYKGSLSSRSHLLFTLESEAQKK